MKIIVTGFDPFGGEPLNSSYEAVKLLPESIENHEIIKICLPTTFEGSAEVLIKAIIKQQPQIVVCVGQAGGRTDISIEKLAINLQDSNIADNNGIQPIDKAIIENAPNAYFSNLPVKKIVEKIRNNKIPASVSYSAGTFICNHTMYNLLHYIYTDYPDLIGGFIHVPYLPEQVINKPDKAHMSKGMIAESLTYAILASVESLQYK